VPVNPKSNRNGGIVQYNNDTVGQQIGWSGCDEDVHVRGLSLDHLGHEWPGSKPSRWNQTNSRQSLDLTDVLWSFFSSEN
jgi:poly(3-hydroxybutyrate) depolymerase